MRSLSTAASLLLLAVAGCATNPGVLPPPPKVNVMALEERLQVVIGETEVAFEDTARPVVRDASTMGQTVADSVSVGEPAPRARTGTLVPRFPAGTQAPADPVRRTRELVDSIVEARVEWTSLADVADSLAFHKSWDRLYDRMLPGAELPVRSIVWPEPVRVITRQPGELVLASGWVPFGRIPSNEIRCLASGSSSPDRPGESPSVRFLATLQPIAGRSAQIRIRYDVRALVGCSVSPIGLDRLLAFRFDIWNVANRVGSIGLPGISLIR